MELLHILTVCKRLIFLLSCSGVLHVTEPVLDCLTNIAEGSLPSYRASIILMCLVQVVFFFKKHFIFFILVKPTLVFV